jgi:hypothetical protein
VKYYGITVTAKRRNKSDGERTYPMTERVPFTDLASWQEEGVDSHVVVAADPGGGVEKYKQWRESIFEVTPYRAGPDILDMSHRWSGYIRLFET